jgi:hypothetical protein
MDSAAVRTAFGPEPTPPAETVGMTADRYREFLVLLCRAGRHGPQLTGWWAVRRPHEGEGWAWTS